MFYYYFLISGLPAGYLDAKIAAGVGFVLGSQLITLNFLYVSFFGLMKDVIF